jgi:heptosyltransferase-2/heptosyltransferase-3
LAILLNRWLPEPTAANTGTGLLLIRPDHLGDLLFLAPALHWLRRQAPDLPLTLMVGPWARPALPALAGAYDELLEVPFPAFARGKRQGVVARWRLAWQLGQTLAGRGLAAALILRPDHWWGALVARLARIPVRLGYDTDETAPYLSRRLPLRYEHAVARNLRLVGAFLGDEPVLEPTAHPLRFPVGAADREAAMRLWATTGGRRPYVVIHPGAGAAVKLWEPTAWAAVARGLHAHGATVVVTGGPDEAALTAAVVAAAGGTAVDLGGRTSFGVLAGLLAQADLVLGPDSGPLHLAVAVGTPTIHLFGPADPVLFGPWGDPRRHGVLCSPWACAPCGRLDWPDVPAHGCVRGIAPEQVLNRALTLLADH